MSWRDRDWGRDDDPMRAMGRPGGDWRGLAPRLENPLSWSVSMGRVFGIDVRVHVIMLLFIVIELFRAQFGAVDRGRTVPHDLFLTGFMLAGLFVIVLLHEFGHCFACRSTGGSADEILMWPLGGLAYCMPPHRWTAHLITVVGGPLVNVALIPIFAIPLYMQSGQWGVAIPFPLIGFPDWWHYESNLWLLALFLVANINMILLLFNLLPLFPLDGGRLLQSLLWPRLGYVRSMQYAVYVGYFGAIALGIYGFVIERFLLVGIAAFGGITCWVTLKQLRYTQEMMGFDYDGYAQDMGQDEPESPRQSARALKRQQKKAEQAREQLLRDETELDRLLGKIAESGMGSLTRKERKWLERHSKTKRSNGE